MARPLLVIAKYTEDISWADHLPSNWETFVVAKDVEDQEPELFKYDMNTPNEGREAASYCLAFRSLSSELADDDILCCVQGDPFVHSRNLVRELYHPPTHFTYLQGWVTSCDGEGAPHHSGLPVAERYEEWFGDAFPGSLDFGTGAQFFVSGAELKQHDWDKWYERSCTEYGPWLMERFWPRIFSEQKG